MYVYEYNIFCLWNNLISNTKMLHLLRGMLFVVPECSVHTSVTKITKYNPFFFFISLAAYWYLNKQKIWKHMILLLQEEEREERLSNARSNSLMWPYSMWQTKHPVFVPLHNLYWFKKSHIWYQRLVPDTTYFCWKKRKTKRNT